MLEGREKVTRGKIKCRGIKEKGTTKGENEEK